MFLQVSVYRGSPHSEAPYSWGGALYSGKAKGARFLHIGVGSYTVEGHYTGPHPPSWTVGLKECNTAVPPLAFT